MLANAVFMRIGLPLNLELPPLPFDRFGHSLRFIRDLEYQVRGLAFCATTLGIALVLTKSQIARFDAPRSLWLGVGLGCGIVVLFGAIYGDLYEWVFVGKKRPVALIELGTGGMDMVLDGSKGFIVGRNDMRVVDLKDPSKLQLNAGKVSFPQWNMIQATAANGKVYISGTKTIETVKEKGFVIVGFNAQGEPVLEKEYSLPVADAKEQACWIGRPVVVGDYLYIGVLQKPNYVQVLLTLDLRGDEPVVINRLVLGPIRSTEFSWHEPPGYRHRGPPNADLWDLNKQNDPALLTLHLQGRYGYLVTANGVYVADFQDPAEPKNVHHIPIKDWHEFDLSNFGRPSVLDGERLYVRRYWPREMVIYELAQPGKPVEVGTSRAMHLIRNIAHADGYHYVSRQGRVEVLDAASYSAEERWILEIQDLESRNTFSRPGHGYMAAANGYIYGLFGTELAVFDQVGN
jgi:hypothetical protein